MHVHHVFFLHTSLPSLHNYDVIEVTIFSVDLIMDGNGKAIDFTLSLSELGRDLQF